MRLSIICFSIAFFASIANCKVLSDPIKSYENYQVLRVQITSKENYEILSSIRGIHFWNEGRIGSNADIMIAPEEIEEFKSFLVENGFEFSVMVENVGDLIRLEKVPVQNTKYIPNSQHSMTWTEYHKQEDIESFLDYLADTYDFVEVESIGESHEGRPMRVIKVCKNGCGNKPAMWIDAGIHAREWIGPAAITWMMHELIENDAEHSDLTENLDWFFLPVVNPDGYAYTQSNNRMWRKTRTSNSFGLCHGTDANRNWGYEWNTGGSSGNGCSDTYHGPEAFSEVENRNMRDFVLKHKDEIKFFNTLHSYSQLVLLPWGNSYDAAPGIDKMQALADKANQALFDVHGTSFDVGCIPCLLYIASGGSSDWALGEAGIPYAYAMELRDTGRYGFILPPEQIIPAAEEVWAFHVSAAQSIIEEFV